MAVQQNRKTPSKRGARRGHDGIKKPTLSVDAMGGDHGTSVTLPGTGIALQRNPDLAVTLVGPEESLAGWVADLPADLADRVKVSPESGVVGMADRPSQALRLRSGSTMGRIIDLVHSGEVRAASGEAWWQVGFRAP